MGLQSFKNWMKIQLLGIKTVGNKCQAGREADANVQGSWRHHFKEFQA
jgi:hypothetical protein